MTEREPVSGRSTALWLILFAAIAFAVRVGIFYHAVYAHDFVTFVETDAWYHMRLVDATVKHFPSRLWFDPYLVYPGGEPVNPGPFFDWIIAGAALIIGLGAPSPRLVDLVGAYTPPVMGALTLVPVYALGRELFSRRAGLWAAFIVGLLPGQFLIRSSLGFTDHHCAETLLTAAALMWLVPALDRGRPRRQRLRFSAAAGLTFGCYLLTWGGGSLFVLVVVASMAATLFVQRLRGEPAEDLAVLTPAFGVAALMVVPWVGTRPYFGYDVAALAAGLAGLVLLRAWGTATLTLRRGRFVYVAALVAALALGLAIAWFARGGWSELAQQIQRISPWRSAGYVAEATPLLKSPTRYPVPLWKEFTSSLFLAMLGGICYLWRPGALTSSRGLLLVVWSVSMLAATFGQVRFAYYLAVNVALLAGLACDELLASAARFRPAGNRLVRWIAALALLIAVVAPPADALREAWGHDSEFSEDWYDALQWLQSNTPEPLEAGSYEKPAADAQAGIPPRGYGILAWWDYGYWITRVARRIPNSNPKQTQAKEVASFLVAQTEQAAEAALAPLGTRFVVVNAKLQASIADGGADRAGSFAFITSWAGRPWADYCQYFDLAEDKGTVRTQVYCFPQYYRTMLVRLYAFGGKAVAPSTVTAIRWTNQRRDNRPVNRLEEQKTFGTTAEAELFIRSRPVEHWRIASSNALVSCTPLEALTVFRQVFQSIGRQGTASGGSGPAVVQIYEYRPAAGRP